MYDASLLLFREPLAQARVSLAHAERVEFVDGVPMRLDCLIGAVVFGIFVQFAVAFAEFGAGEQIGGDAPESDFGDRDHDAGIPFIERLFVFYRGRGEDFFHRGGNFGDDIWLSVLGCWLWVSGIGGCGELVQTRFLVVGYRLPVRSHFDLGLRHFQVLGGELDGVEEFAGGAVFPNSYNISFASASI